MKDREIIESFMNGIKSEMMMYTDSLSPNSLPYIKDLKKQYENFEKDLEKIDGTYYKKNKNNDNEKTNVDNELYDMIDEFNKYLEYKEDYQNNNSKEKLDMSHQELTHFLTLLEEMFDNIIEHSADNIDEKSMIKSTIKSIYTKVG